MKSQTSGRTTVILLVALNLFVLLYFVIIPRAAASTGCFPDTNGHWAEEFICWMSDQGLVGGYPDGTFKPNNQVTRAELSVITSKTYDLVEANDDDTLGDLSCSTDQIAKWNGSAWECRADLSGAGGDYYTKGEVDAMMAALESRVEALETKLASVSLENGGEEFIFTGVNVHVRDGSGDTDGTVNGLGNLIVGYNEDTSIGGTETRTGSHNLVLGAENEYTSYGGFVGGFVNTISGPYSAVSSGRYNTASGTYSSVSGGRLNTASGTYSSVSGGRYNTASGPYSSVLGGGGDSSSDGNEAWADYSIIAGGRSNVAGDDSGADRTVGEASAVLAGGSNRAEADLAAVSGGQWNTASGHSSSISGGWGNTANGIVSSVSGGNTNTASGTYSSVSGGYDNTASGDYSSVSGGRLRSVSGLYDWRAGLLFETQ